MPDLTDVAAWVGAVSGIGSFLVAWRTHRDQKSAPIRAEQRALRATVRSDAQTVLERIKASQQAARDSEHLDLENQPAGPLDRWANSTESGQFTSGEIPAAIWTHRLALIRWNTAVFEYKQAIFRHTSAVERNRRYSDQSNGDTTLQEEMLARSRELGSATVALTAAAKDARESVDAIIRLLNQLDKKP